MTTEQWVAILGAVATLALAGAALLRVRHDRAAGVSGNEIEAKRDERADWAAFAAEYRQALEDERRRTAEQADRLDALQARLDAKDAAIRLRDDHIDALEHHVWQRLPPPPPARPVGI